MPVGVAIVPALWLVLIVVDGIPAASAPAVLERLDLTVNGERGFSILGMPDRLV